MDIRHIWRLGALAAASGALAACNDSGGLSQRSLQPIPPETLALMQQAGVAKDSPTLLRSYKKEAELQVWKMRSDGRYVHLKTYPICRWSGQLGPKQREGDRQAPEGFYSIAPGQMNPSSNYYLSFNVGYPNAYDRAFGRGGGSIMVHGACSSAGCFSMTDQQIAEIYAIMRTSFNAGQRSVQMQSFPFHMTAENLAKHRLDPNIGFWKQLKEGSDHFEVTGQEPSVAVCGKRYVFNAQNGAGLDPNAPCPALKQDPDIKGWVAEKAERDEAKAAELAAIGLQPVRLVYQDGGQNPAFQGRVAEVSRPEALAAAPVEIALEEKTAEAAHKPAPKGAAAGAPRKAEAKRETEVVAREAAPPESGASAEPSRWSALSSEAASWLGFRKEPSVAGAAEPKASGAKKPEAPLGTTGAPNVAALAADGLRESVNEAPLR